MSAQLIPFTKITSERPAEAQTLIAGELYTALVRDHLPQTPRHASAIEKTYGLPPSVQHLLAYGSAPATPSLDLLKRWQAAHLQHERINRMTDEEFFDWQIYGHVYDKSERRFMHERLAPRPPSETDPYALIEQELNECYGPVNGIPGFYILDDVDAGGHLRVKTFPPHSLIVPCRIDSTFRALQVYPKAHKVDFFWYSTPKATGGASARASLHIANQYRGERERVCVIASHTIEADTIAWESGECAVAVNGLSPLRLVRDLRLAMSDLKACVLGPALPDSIARTLAENGLRVRLLGMEGGDNV